MYNYRSILNFIISWIFLFPTTRWITIGKNHWRDFFFFIEIIWHSHGSFLHIGTSCNRTFYHHYKDISWEFSASMRHRTTSFRLPRFKLYQRCLCKFKISATRPWVNWYRRTKTTLLYYRQVCLERLSKNLLFLCTICL